MSTPQSTSVTTKHRTGCGTLYVTRAGERVTASLGKAGGCAASQVGIITALLSLALVKGASSEDVARCLRGTSCPHASPPRGVLSCGDALAEAMAQEATP